MDVDAVASGKLLAYPTDAVVEHLLRDGAAIVGGQLEQGDAVHAQHLLVVAALAAQIDDARDVVRAQELLRLVHLEAPANRQLRSDPAQIQSGLRETMAYFCSLLSLHALAVCAR
jgi:hypothetical protein